MTLAWVKSVVSVIAVACMTSGCIMYSLETLRNTEPTGTPFQKELAKLYMDFATQGEKEYDWFNSWHFADKGLMLAYGKDVGPEDLKDWDIPEDKLPELEKARTMVMSVRTPELMNNSPSRIADAQFYFDCWVKYQEANWQEEEIAFCRDSLMNVLEGLTAPSEIPVAKMKTKKSAKVHSAPISAPEAVSTPSESIKPAPVATTPLPKTTPAAKEATPETISYAVFFESGKAQLSQPGKNVISEILDSLKNVSHYEIFLHVSANKDAVGLLSNERAQVVKKQLIEGSIAENAIKIADTASEIESATPTVHRVEVFLNE